MRFVIATVKHETNTFSPIRTPLASFAIGRPDGLPAAGSRAIVLHINNFIASKALYYAIPALFLSFFITQITLVASFRYFSNAFTTEVLKSSNVGKNLQ